MLKGMGLALNNDLQQVAVNPNNIVGIVND